MGRRFQYSRGVDVPFVPPTTPNLGWHAPWTDPLPRRKVNPRYSVPTVALFSGSAPPSFGWHQALSDPSKSIRRPPVEVSGDAFFLPPAFFSMGWLEPWEQPVRPNRRPVPEHPPHALGQPQASVAPSTGWLVAWEPAPPRRPRLFLEWDAGVFFLPPTFLSMGWLEEWTQPAARRRLPPDAFALGLPQAYGAPSFGWHDALSLPVKPRPVLHVVDGNVFFTPLPGATGFFDLGWLSPLSEPNRPRKPPPEHPAHFIGQGQPAPYPAPSFGWHEPWVDPLRPRKAIHEAQGQVVFVPLSGVNLGWLAAWDQPLVRAKKLLVDADGNVLVSVFKPPSFGWHQALSEPYRPNRRPVPENPAHFLTLAPPPPFLAPNYGWHAELARPYRRGFRPVPENPAQFWVPRPFVFAPVNATLLAAALERRLVAGTFVRLRVASSPQRIRTATFVPNRNMSQATPLDPPIDPGEQETVGFDYGPALGAGVSLIAQQPTVNVTVSQESLVQDGTPQSRLASPTQTLVASKKTGAAQAQWNVLFGPPLPGVVYLLQCLAQTSDGQTLSIWVRFAADQPS